MGRLTSDLQRSPRLQDIPKNQRREAYRYAHLRNVKSLISWVEVILSVAVVGSAMFIGENLLGPPSYEWHKYLGSLIGAGIVGPILYLRQVTRIRSFYGDFLESRRNDH